MYVMYKSIRKMHVYILNRKSINHCFGGHKTDSLIIFKYLQNTTKSSTETGINRIE